MKPVPGSIVVLLVRNSDQTTHQCALVIGVDPALDVNGRPTLELVTVNKNALHHAGTPDFQNALTRGFSVVHASHPDFQERRASMGYLMLPFEILSVEELFGEHDGEDDSEDAGSGSERWGASDWTAANGAGLDYPSEPEAVAVSKDEQAAVTEDSAPAEADPSQAVEGTATVEAQTADTAAV